METSSNWLSLPKQGEQTTQSKVPVQPCYQNVPSAHLDSAPAPCTVPDPQPTGGEAAPGEPETSPLYLHPAVRGGMLFSTGWAWLMQDRSPLVSLSRCTESRLPMFLLPSRYFSPDFREGKCFTSLMMARFCKASLFRTAWVILGLLSTPTV